MNLYLFGVLAGAVVSAMTLMVNVNTSVAPTTPVQHDELTVWLTKLAKNENCPHQGIIDSNGLRSSGIFCYQDRTFIGFVKKYNLLPNTEDKEILNFIGDNEFQLKLTRLVFEDNPKHWTHWFNTVKFKIGLPPDY